MGAGAFTRDRSEYAFVAEVHAICANCAKRAICAKLTISLSCPEIAIHKSGT